MPVQTEPVTGRHDLTPLALAARLRAVLAAHPDSAGKDKT